MNRSRISSVGIAKEFEKNLDSDFQKSNQFLKNFEDKVKEISDFSQKSNDEEVKINLEEEMPKFQNIFKPTMKNQLEDLAIKYNPFRKSKLKPEKRKSSKTPPNPKLLKKKQTFVLYKSKDGPLIQASFYQSTNT